MKTKNTNFEIENLLEETIYIYVNCGKIFLKYLLGWLSKLFKQFTSEIVLLLGRKKSYILKSDSVSVVIIIQNMKHALYIRMNIQI